ncbi:MAG: YfhO family protein [Eubacteriales bacterium]
MDTIAESTISRPKKRLSENAKTLLWCFFLPALLTIVIYCCLQVYPVGGNSVLVLDLNAQYIYYFEQLRDILTSGESILYSFERALGGEFLGIFAYYLSSPFSLLVALFPKRMITEAMYLILVLKCGFCGLSFGYYLTKKKLTKPPYRIMLSTMYALSSFAVVMQHNVMWTDNLIAFPLLMLGLDELICHGKFKLYVVSLVYAILSNFYIGYMACLFVAVWFFIRYFMFTPSERGAVPAEGGETNHFLRTLGRIVLWSLTALAISAILLLPVYYSLSFGKLEFSDPDYTPEQLFNFADLLTKAFFGSYDTVRPEGMPFLFCGTLALLLAPLYFFSDRFPTRRKVGYAAILLFLAASFNFSLLDIFWHGMQRPNWLNARFAYMFAFLLLVLTAHVLEHLHDFDRRTLMASAVFWCAMLVIQQKMDYDFLNDFIVVWGGIFLLALYAALVPTVAKFTETTVSEGADTVRSRRLSIGLCAVVIVEMLLNALAMVYQFDADVSYSNRNSYRQMVDTYDEAVAVLPTDSSFYRAEKLVHRRKNDNFALDINGLSNSTSTLNARVVDLLHRLGYAAQSHWSMYIGANAVTDALFDIRYVMADETDNKPVMDYIHRLYEPYASTDGHIDVYENPFALSLAYSADEEILGYDVPPEDPDEDRFTDPFTYMNDLLSALLGHDVKVWHACRVAESEIYGVDIAFVTGHRGYEANGEMTPKLQYLLDIESDDLLYAYFPSDWPRECTMKVNDRDIGTFFDSQNFAIRELGSFEVGETVDFRLYLEEDDLYLRSGCQFFWYFDEEAFAEAIAELKEGVMDALSEKDSRVFGTIRVPEGDSVVFTTIPYDAGWEVRVDGQAVETLPVLNETLLAFRITPGEHELEFVYRPACVRYGLLLSISGLAVFGGACAFDGRRKAKKTGPNETTNEENRND